MNALCEIKQKPGDLTKDFNILPSVDHIKSLINEDAEKIANKIKQDLLQNIESGRGFAHTGFNVGPLYEKLVINKLKIWTKLHKYDVDVSGSTINIRPVGVRKKSKPHCSVCGKPLESAKKIATLLFGVSIIGSIGISLPLVFAEPTAFAASVPLMIFFGMAWVGIMIDKLGM